MALRRTCRLAQLFNYLKLVRAQISIPVQMQQTMEIPWFVIFLTLTTIALALKLLFNSSTGSDSSKNNAGGAKLPPGPTRIPFFSDLQWLLRNPSEVEGALIELRSKYGPIVNLKFGGGCNAVYIFNNELAHEALVQNGAIFAERPPASELVNIISCNQHAISYAPYGPLWRILRRHLTMKILNPSRIKSFSHSRKWVLHMLNNKLKSESESGKKPIQVVGNFQYAMFCLLANICFGDILENEKVVRDIEKVERDFAVALHSFQILTSLPPLLSKIVFRNLWYTLFKTRRNLETVYIPLIRARQAKQQHHQQQEDFTLSYVDSLLNLSIPEEVHVKEEGNGRRRKLKEEEIVSLCSEFLEGGIDTTTAALQWIMANLVKNQEIQEKLYNEITTTCTNSDEDDNTEKDGEIKEDDLHKMPYLKAVVLEGLRRHPPARLLLPHAVTEDVTIGGYMVKKGSLVNFLVYQIGLDPKVWEDPMEFKPERFLTTKDSGAGDHHNGKSFDVMGIKEIKMLPFGAGRRICPGIGLAMLHLEYFVANLVKDFKWITREGDDVDLSEMMEQSTVLKYPLWVHVTPRN